MRLHSTQIITGEKRTVRGEMQFEMQGLFLKRILKARIEKYIYTK